MENNSETKIYEITCINPNGDAHYVFCTKGEDAKEARRNAERITQNTILSVKEANLGIKKVILLGCRNVMEERKNA